MMPILQLTRPRLSALVAASALAGGLAGPRPPGPVGLAALGCGVLLLTAGCSALNQFQERDTDALMRRTGGRPLPAGRLTPRAGLLAAVLMLGAGLGTLGAAPGPVVVLLGLFAACWYNGVYTPLKRHSRFAVLPGALCGVIPPLMGWVSAGGDPGDHRIVVFSGLLFLWQIPHFWLFTLRHREDFQRAGLPTIFDAFSASQVLRIALAWSLALATGGWLLLGLGVPQAPAARLLAAAVILWLTLRTLRGLRRGAPAQMFGTLNLFMALLIGSLLVNAFTG
ncbi:hypothetical protein DESUT3_31290 [Desulfuromonas versatilis]|uniref:Protoheme IX farnesyltransferase n=1 Tax=Desulfuromonas versatilis TaxID=2802975 RepID=A0ABN6E173_9BACT|nr:protoheme IX farnesyltransferase [Desulfuromonas versatilis]BCR06060.1 hypothetical protein DESUT3_31290 [Desulfuromonas versatilis]